MADIREHPPTDQAGRTSRRPPGEQPDGLGPTLGQDLDTPPTGPDLDEPDDEEDEQPSLF